jgi:hypothetical protein
MVTAIQSVKWRHEWSVKCHLDSWKLASHFFWCVALRKVSVQGRIHASQSSCSTTQVMRQNTTNFTCYCTATILDHLFPPGSSQVGAKWLKWQCCNDVHISKAMYKMTPTHFQEEGNKVKEKIGFATATQFLLFVSSTIWVRALRKLFQTVDEYCLAMFWHFRSPGNIGW